MIDAPQAQTTEVEPRGLPDVQAAEDQPRQDEGSGDAFNEAATPEGIVGTSAQVPTQPIISAEDQKKIDRMIERARRNGSPLTVLPGKKAAHDSYGRVYMRSRGAGNVRVILNEDGTATPSRSNPALRKAERKALRIGRKAAARQVREARQAAKAG